MLDLNSFLDPSGAGWVLKDALAINANGQITGFGTIGGQTHAFLLTPVVPEPSSRALAAFALVGLIALGWRRRNR